MNNRNITQQPASKKSIDKQQVVTQLISLVEALANLSDIPEQDSIPAKAPKRRPNKMFGEWHQMDSSVINKISIIQFPKGSSVMYVWFHSGNAYEYHNVSLDMFNEFLNAGSPGLYFNEHFRNWPKQKFHCKVH